MRMQSTALCSQYTNKNVVVIELSRRLSRKRPTSRTFIRLITCAYKRQSRQEVVRIQLALCEVECEQNSHGHEDRHCKDRPNSC